MFQVSGLKLKVSQKTKLRSFEPQKAQKGDSSLHSVTYRNDIRFVISTPGEISIIEQ